MILSTMRNGLAALLLGTAILAPVMAQTVLELPAPAQKGGVDLRRALALAPGDALRLERLPLGEQNAEIVSADLRRTRTDNSAPLLVVHSDSGVTTTHAEQRAHFTGHLVGELRSSVFVSIDSHGGMRSIVRRGQDVYISEMAAPGSAGDSKTSAPALRSRRVDFSKDALDRSLSIATPSQNEQIPYSTAQLENLRSNYQRAGTLGLAAYGPEALGAQRRADIIIETDYEMYQVLGSISKVHAYVTDLLGFVSSQFESEIGARLNITQISVYTSRAADPWTDTTNLADLLAELRTYWNDPGRINQERHHVQLLSGRDLSFAGTSYINTLDRDSRGYSYSAVAGIDGSFSTQNPRFVFDSLMAMKQLGRVFGSFNTHEFDDPRIDLTHDGAIDCCGIERSGQCSALLNSTTGVLPGIGSLTDGTPDTGAGTIMSHCYVLNPGIRNMSMTFGTNHTRGVKPWRVASVLQSSAQTYLPLDNGVQNYTLSVSRQGAGGGTVASTPAGINCGSTCSASFAGGAQVTLTAQATQGSSFSGWGGACTGAANSCTVTMDSARSVTANFSQSGSSRMVSLTKSGSGSGNVTSTPSGLSCGTGCTSAMANFTITANIGLTAQAASGSTFAGWSGACSGKANCTIPAGTSSANVVAIFNTSGGGDSGAYIQQVMTLFTGYFGRPAAPNGQSYYEGLMAQSGGNYRILVDDFYKSAESQAIYGGLGVSAQVTQVFRQLFSRDPQPSGLTYWTQQVNQGVISVPEIAYTVAYNAADADSAVLSAKRRAALEFTKALAANTQYANAYGQSQALGRAYLGCVNGDAAASAAIARLPTTMANMAAGSNTYTCP